MRTRARAVAFRKTSRTLTAFRAALLCALGVSAAPAFTQAGNTDDLSYRFDITALTLPQALRAYAQTAGQEIIFTENLFEGTKPVTLKGDYTAADALARLLRGTGLVAKRSPTGAIMIKRAERQTATWAPAQSNLALRPARANDAASPGIDEVGDHFE